MRPHLIVKTRTRISRELPHWEQIIENKRAAVEQFGTSLDTVFRRHRAPFWLTQEYPAALHAGFDGIESASGLASTYRVILQDASSVSPELLRDVQAHPGVEWAHVGGIAHTTLPHLATQASRSPISSWPADAIGLDYAHAFSKGSEQITVAVLDTGVDQAHPELVGRVRNQKDVVDFEGLDTSAFLGDLFGVDDSADDEVGHGTHVAGIIAGAGTKMPQGVAPRCTVLPVRVLAAMNDGGRRVGAGLVDNINVGIKWAVDNGADVINMSLGIQHEQGGVPHAEVVKYALAKGVTIVAAAGNDGLENRYYPGAIPGVLAIGAFERSGEVASFSTFGPHIAFLAPGVEILSAAPGGKYAAASGTSQAAPFASGAIGLLKSFALGEGRRLDDRNVKTVLSNTSDRLDNRPRHPRAGGGRLNLADAVRFLAHNLNRATAA